MVAEQHPLVGGVEVDPVLQALGRGGTGVVDLEDLAGDEPGVEAVGDRVRAEGRHDQPDGRDLLTPGQGEHGPAERADKGDG